MATSKMLEGYCADVEHLVREGFLRQAVRLAVALPEICSALERAGMQSSRGAYVGWCVKWLRREQRDGKAVTGERLYRLRGRLLQRISGPDRESAPPQALLRLRMRRHQRSYRGLGRARLWDPHNRLEHFQVALCEELVEAARDWYRDYGRDDQTVQTNIGKLLATR